MKILCSAIKKDFILNQAAENRLGNLSRNTVEKPCAKLSIVSFAFLF